MKEPNHFFIKFHTKPWIVSRNINTHYRKLNFSAGIPFIKKQSLLRHIEGTAELNDLCHNSNLNDKLGPTACRNEQARIPESHIRIQPWNWKYRNNLRFPHSADA